MTNEKIFSQYVFKCRYRWATSEFPVAAQAVVVDPDGGGSVALRIALSLCVRLWRGTVYLHPFLNESKGFFTPQDFLPWLYLYQAGEDLYG